MNINDKSQIRECTSCQMCGAVCPTSAIEIRLNENGFYRPYIDSDKCIDCGLCVKSCYKFDSKILDSDISSKKIVAAWANDRQVVEETTSGGIADVMARKLIGEGYICIGVVFDADSNCARGRIANSLDETRPFRGSKYIQSLSVDAFKSLVKNFRQEKYAVFGLPCQVYAIDRYLKLRGVREQHILIDLYCHGCPSLNVWNKYTDSILRKVNGKKILSANFRSKIRGWGNFYVVVVVVVEGVSSPIKVVSPRINDGFYELFFSDEVLNDSCPDCKLRSTLEYTDIRLGDFWGKSYISNHSGVSGITISTERGNDLIDSIKSDLTIHEQEFSNFLPYQSYGKVYKVNSHTRDVLLKALASNDKSIDDVVKIYIHSLPLKKRIIHSVKNVVKLLPNNLISTVKGSFYRLQGK